MPSIYPSHEAHVPSVRLGIARLRHDQGIQEDKEQGQHYGGGMSFELFMIVWIPFVELKKNIIFHKSVMIEWWKYSKKV